MSDYISRQAAIEEIRKAENHAFNSFYKGLVKAHKIVADLLPADVTPVVHCRDCAKLNRNGYCTRFQNNISGIATSWFMPDDDDFCSYGEYREE